MAHGNLFEYLVCDRYQYLFTCHSPLFDGPILSSATERAVHGRCLRYSDRLLVFARRQKQEMLPSPVCVPGLHSNPLTANAMRSSGCAAALLSWTD